MGQFSRNLLCDPVLDPVLPTDIHYIHVEDSGESEYTNDVHTNAWQLHMGSESGCTSRSVGMECMGRVLCDWLFTRHAFGDGKLLRNHKPEAGEARA